MEKQYYIASKSNRLGPFSLSQLSEKAINHDTLIWYEGIEQWTKAEEIDELKSIIPPPTPYEVKFQTKRIVYKKIFCNEKKVLTTGSKYIGILFCMMFVLLFISLGGFRDRRNLVDALFQIGVYTSVHDVKSVIVGISLLWSFFFSVISFVLYYLYRKEIGQQIINLRTFKYLICIVGILYHLWTAIIIFENDSFSVGMKTLLLPVLSEIYWFPQMITVNTPQAVVGAVYATLVTSYFIAKKKVI